MSSKKDLETMIDGLRMRMQSLEYTRDHKTPEIIDKYQLMADIAELQNKLNVLLKHLNITIERPEHGYVAKKEAK